MEQQEAVCNFRDVVESYVNLSEHERELRTKLKDLRARKQTVSEEIMKHMHDMNVDSCRLPANRGRVVLRTVTKDPTLSTKEVHQLVSSHAPPTFVNLLEEERLRKQAKTTTTLVHRAS